MYRNKSQIKITNFCVDRLFSFYNFYNFNSNLTWYLVQTLVTEFPSDCIMLCWNALFLQILISCDFHCLTFKMIVDPIQPIPAAAYRLTTTYFQPISKTTL